MVSLLKFAEITETGVKFESPVDGSEMMLTPEQSIKCQNEIGADIMMQLDDVVSSVNADQDRFSRQHIEVSVGSGSLYQSAQETVRAKSLRDNSGGLIHPREKKARTVHRRKWSREIYPVGAIGGLAGGEDKESFWRVVVHNAKRLLRTSHGTSWV